MGLLGFATDVAVGTLVGRIPVGGVVARGMLGGALGGLAGEAVENGWDPEGFFKAAGLGALGGVGGGLISKFAGNRLADSAKAGRNLMNDADKPYQQWTTAKAEAEAAGERLARLQSANSGARGLTSRIPGVGSRRASELDAARTAVDDWKAKVEELGPVAEKIEKNVKFKEALARQLSNLADADKFKWYQDWGTSTLIGLGSALVVESYDAASNAAGGGNGQGEQSAEPSPVPLVWDGLAPAQAAGLMWKHPFTQEQSVLAEGAGFLLRPKELTAGLVSWYGGPSNSFAHSLVENFQMFGDLEKKEELKVAPIPKVSGGGAGTQSSAGGVSYEQTVASLTSAATALDESQVDLAATIEKVEQVSQSGKENIGALISGVNMKMQGIQDNSDISFLTILTQAFGELVGVMEEAIAQNELAANEIEDPTMGDESASEDLANSVGNFANGQNDPALWPDAAQSGLTDPATLDNLTPGGLDTPGTPTADLQDSVDRLGDSTSDALQSANDRVIDPPDVTPASYTPPSTAMGGATDPMGGMGGLMNSLLPMMMQQAAMRNMADSDLSGRMPQIDPGRYDRAAAPTMPQPQQPGTTPWSNQAAANNTAAQAQPAHHQAGAPSGATSTQPSGGLPKRVAGADGLVPYSFPDGRTQRVPLAVAQALDKAFANKTGTDAQAAYAETPAAWTDPKDIGPAVDPFELATGDVATWTVAKGGPDEGTVPVGAQATVGTNTGGPTPGEQKTEDQKPEAPKGDSEYRTAVLVAFGEGESGTLEAVVNGELRQYTPDMSDAEGAFGDFAGFKHPKNIEAAGDKGQDTGAAATGADQSTTDVPVLAAPV